jgi:glucose-1-phosphate thymidylyltransferase
VLGDNIFYGQGFPELLRCAAARTSGATIFGYRVKDPERYGVMEFDKSRKVISLEEKPENPKSHYAIVGLYFYDQQITDIAADIKPSARGELEITDVNRVYLERNQLQAEILGRGFAWLDTGTHDSLLQASNYVEALQNRQGLKVACLEEIAYQLGYITGDQVLEQARRLGKSEYSKYITDLVTEHDVRV